MTLRCLGRCGPTAEVSDIYDNFQDQCTDLLSADGALSYLQIQKFMPHLLELWNFQDLKDLNTNKVEIQIITDE
jgi:hypothetical protein